MAHSSLNIGVTSVLPQRSRIHNRSTPLILQLIAMLGIASLTYPFAANWFSTLHHQSGLYSYEAQTTASTEESRLEALEQAHAYNSAIPTGLIRDPFVAAPTGMPSDLGAYDAYRTLLHPTRSGVVGQIDYPDLGIHLPIYPGTNDEILRKGVGHLYGSSLPVGGPSTRSVLTSHSGLVSASLFSKLHHARPGQIIRVNVLGNDAYYQVQQLEKVLPDDTRSLNIVPGEDWVTLLTCTPIGVNSHRLLVHAKRIDQQHHSSADFHDASAQSFPWWALIFVGGSAAIALALFAPTKTKNTTRAFHKFRRNS